MASTLLAGTNGLAPLALRSELGGTWVQLDPGIAMAASGHSSLFAMVDYVDGIHANTGHGLEGSIEFRLTW